MSTHLSERKSVLIFETFNKPMRLLEKQVDANSKRYVFEGPCAEFGVVNDNGRIYTKEDYVPHLEYLKSEIELGLMGSLDHPEDYEVTMKSVSHIIRDIWYNQSLNEVWIKFEVIETDPDGKNVMKIIDSGAPIYISSRASGFIDENGKVNLEKIYTFDIVYRPGFRKAKMNRLNESLNLNSTENDSSSISVFEMTENKINNPIINKSKVIMKEEEKPITRSEFNTYMTKLQETLTASILKNNSPKIDGGQQNFSKINESKEDLESIKTKLQELSAMTEAGDAETMKAKILEIEKSLGDHQEYMDLMCQYSNDIIGYMDLMTERVNKLTEYCEVVADTMNSNIKETDVLVTDVKEGLTKVTDHMDSVVESVNENFEQIEKFVDNVSESVNENFKEVTKFVDIVAESVNENFEQVIKFTDSMVESVNENNTEIVEFLDKTSDTVNENFGLPKVGQTINESRMSKITEALKSGSITKLVESKINEVKKKTNFAGVAEFNFLDKATLDSQSLFESMPTTKKKRVTQMVSKKMEVNEAITKVANESAEVSLLLSNVPKDKIKLWESLDQNDQKAVITLFRSRQISDDHSTSSFWESIDMGDSVKITESLENVDFLTFKGPDSDLGYGTDEVEKLLNI